MFDELGVLMREKLEVRPDEGSSKVMPLPEAIKAFIRPGMVLNLASAPSRSMASLHELMRQYRGQEPGFGLISSGFNTVTSGAALIRARMLKKVISAFVGAIFPSPGPSMICQSAYAEGSVEFEHWTMLTIVLRLKAAAMGLPFTPTKSMLGSGMERDNAHAFRAVDDPFHPGERIGLLHALHPDISIVHGLAADKHGNTIMVPPYGENTWGAMAAKEGAIVTVERIVPTEVIRRYSHFCRLPGYFVRSVTEVPFGAHPMGVHNQWITGLDAYAEDYEFMMETRKAEQNLGDLDAWMENWIYSVRNHQEYLDKVGFQRLLFLRGKAQWDSYRQEFESVKEKVDLGPESSALEHLVAVSSRIIASRVREKGHKTILSGVGTAHVAAGMANAGLKAAGVDIDLMAELGFYGFQPRPCDPFIFNHRNIYTCKSLTDYEHVLGIFVSGAQNRCLGSLSAAQIDKHGNINSTYLSKKVMLVGSGGANDVASAASEVIVTAAQSRRRFVDEVFYVTSPGRAVTTVVSDLGVYEKLGADTELTLTGYLVRPGVASEDDAVRKIKEECGWDLKVAPRLQRHEEPSLEELGVMRMLDPHRQFLE